MAGAVEKAGRLDAGAHVERAHALGRVELVAGEAQEVDAQLAHVHPDLAGRLRRVRVHQDPALVGEARDLGDRLDRSDLVVRVHDADEDRLRGEGRRDVGRVDPALLVDPAPG